jgi:hypothetical protein
MPPPPRVELPGSHGAGLAQLAEQQQQQQQQQRQGTPRAGDRGAEQFSHGAAAGAAAAAAAAGLQQQQQASAMQVRLMRGGDSACMAFSDTVNSPVASLLPLPLYGIKCCVRT